MWFYQMETQQVKHDSVRMAMLFDVVDVRKKGKHPKIKVTCLFSTTKHYFLIMKRKKGRSPAHDKYPNTPEQEVKSNNY